MKKLLFVCLTVGLVNVCAAQAKPKKDTVKFTPPVIEKNKPTPKSKSAVKFTPPVIKKNKPAKRSEKVKFTPPVIEKDKSTK